MLDSHLAEKSESYLVGVLVAMKGKKMVGAKAAKLVVMMVAWMADWTGTRQVVEKVAM